LVEHGRALDQRPYHIDLALGLPKRDAMELCLKQAVELGLGRMYLVSSAYSQVKALCYERLQKILVASLEQSNASFFPELIEARWQEIPWSEYSTKVLLDSQTKIFTPMRGNGSGHCILVVGPEGGFAPQELKE